MQNNNILLFVHSLSLTSLIKALLLSKVCLSTIKHQHSKNLTWWTEATWTKNTWKIKNAYCLQEFLHKECSNVHHLHGYMPGDAFCTGQLQCQWCPVGHWTDHTTIKRSSSSLRTVNEQKVKCWYFT